jgi:hypothetical protein
METLDDRHELYRPYEASCARCKQGFDSIAFTCKAFPEGIPDEILEGKDKHLKPLPGQKNGIVFSPAS